MPISIIDADPQEGQEEQEKQGEKEGFEKGAPEAEPTAEHKMEGFLKKEPSLKDKIPLKKIGIVAGILLLMALVGFGSGFLLKKLRGSNMTAPSFSLSGSSSGKPTITNPINGVQYTSSEAREWQARRPMAVMINDHADARPQKGLASADLIYEAVAEGGISRFLAVFHSKIPEVVGPVRSARVYYIDWAKEYDAWYAHWGYAQTPNEANAYARMQSIFVSSIESAEACQYDETLDRDLEHTLYCDTQKLYDAGYKLYPDQPKEFRTLESWNFKDTRVAPQTSGLDKAFDINLNFWELPEYAVEWRYSEAGNKYERWQGEEKQVDALNNAPLEASNVIVSFMQERQLDDEKLHLIYEDIGTGDALVFLDGRVIEAEWKRLAYSDRTVFYDKATGKEIEFNRGQVWIEVVPDRSEDEVTYQ